MERKTVLCLKMYAYLIAIEADDESALATSPVEVKQRGFANVAHFTHALHYPFPRYRLVCNKINVTLKKCF